MSYTLHYLSYTSHSSPTTHGQNKLFNTHQILHDSTHTERHAYNTANYHHGATNSLNMIKLGMVHQNLDYLENVGDLHLPVVLIIKGLG